MLHLAPVCVKRIGMVRTFSSRVNALRRPLCNQTMGMIGAAGAMAFFDPCSIVPSMFIPAGRRRPGSGEG